MNNLPFVEYQAKKNKPMLISVGAANEDEIDRMMATVRKVNNQPLCILHCVLEYPTPYEHANLNKIASLKEKYKDLIIGYSDHTKPDACADVIKTAYNLGAVVIEKHFTLDKTLKEMITIMLWIRRMQERFSPELNLLIPFVAKVIYAA